MTGEVEGLVEGWDVTGLVDGCEVTGFNEGWVVTGGSDGLTLGLLVLGWLVTGESEGLVDGSFDGGSVGLAVGLRDGCVVTGLSDGSEVGASNGEQQIRRSSIVSIWLFSKNCQSSFDSGYCCTSQLEISPMALPPSTSTMVQTSSK